MIVSIVLRHVALVVVPVGSMVLWGLVPAAFESPAVALAGLAGLATGLGVAAAVWSPPVLARCERCRRLGEFRSVAIARASWLGVEAVSGPPDDDIEGPITHVGLCVDCITEADERAAADFQRYLDDLRAAERVYRMRDYHHDDRD